jgi:hypothetical protein
MCELYFRPRWKTVEHRPLAETRHVTLRVVLSRRSSEFLRSYEYSGLFHRVSFRPAGTLHSTCRFHWVMKYVDVTSITTFFSMLVWLYAFT